MSFHYIIARMGFRLHFNKKISWKEGIVGKKLAKSYFFVLIYYTIIFGLNVQSIEQLIFCILQLYQLTVLRNKQVKQHKAYLCIHKKYWYCVYKNYFYVFIIQQDVEKYVLSRSFQYILISFLHRSKSTKMLNYIVFLTSCTLSIFSIL